MIYSAWYFCTTSNLSVTETKDVLKAIQALEAPRSSFLEKLNVVRCIEAMNSTVQTYMIPYLTRCLLSEEMRQSIDAYENATERQNLIYQIEELLLQVLPKSDHPEIIDLVSALFQMTAEEAGRFAINCKYSAPDAAGADTVNADITEYSLELFLLSVLDCAGESEPVLVGNFVRDDDSDLIQYALSGSCGPICKTLALTLLLHSGVSGDEIISALPEGWPSMPDCLELAAAAFFPKKDNPDAIDDILKEAFNFDRFRKQWQQHRQYIIEAQTDWMAVQKSPEDRERCALVIWQAILYELALNQYPDAFMSSVKDYWRKPKLDHSTNEDWFRINKKEQSLLMPENIGCGSVPALKAAVCSPWQIRSEKKINKGPDINKSGMEAYFHEFRLFRLSHNGLRAFFAVHILQKLYRVFGKTVRIVYTSLLLNLGDAFSCYGARQTFAEITDATTDNDRIEAWPYPIRALGYYANDTLSRLGMGNICSDIPSLVTNAIDKTKKRLEPPNSGGKEPRQQLQYRYDEAAVQVGIHWAFESLSFKSVDEDDRQSPWMARDGEYANRLLDIHFFKRSEFSYSRVPIQLDIQAFHSNHIHMKRPQSGSPQWLRTYQEKKGDATFNFTHLLLSRNPSLGEWYAVVEISPRVFQKDAYLLALTLRAMALIESDTDATEHTTGDEHEYITVLKDHLSAISQPWELSRQARFTMIQFLSAVPGTSKNINVFFELCKQFITLIQEYSDLSTIYYQYLLAKALIDIPSDQDGSGALDPTSIAELRGRFAKNLYCRIQTEVFPENRRRWETLLRFFLNRIPESLMLNSGWYAGSALQEHWANQRTPADAVRSELISPAQWNPLTDLAWIPRADKLLTAFDGIDVRRSSSQIASCWDAIGPKHLKSGKVIGVVVSSQPKNDRHILKINCSDGVERPNVNPDDLSVGMPVLVTINKYSPDAAFKINRLKRAAIPEERIAVQVKIESDKLTLRYADNRNSLVDYYADRDERAFRYWNADTFEYFENKNNKKWSEACDACFEGGRESGIWKPFEQDFVMLLVRVLLTPENREHKCTLTYLGQAEQPGCLLFSEKAGSNYALDSTCWSSDSFSRLEETLAKEDCFGLRIRVQLDRTHTLPVLNLCDDPFDRRNIEWRKQFSPEQLLQAKRVNNKWTVPSCAPEIFPDGVSVFFSGRYPIDLTSVCDVQVTGDGWDYPHQRKGLVEVTKVTERAMPPLNGEQLLKLINIKPGDLFELRSVQFQSNPNAYFFATLDCSEMPVFCAKESVSFQAGKPSEAFWKGRKCIVENVHNYNRPDQNTTRNAIPFNCPGLDSEAEAYLGILTKYYPIIKKQTAETADIRLGVSLLVNGAPYPLEIPFSAFSIEPIGLGDRIHAKPKDGGWVFRADRRTVNVRALWSLEDHRGKGKSEKIGLNLGLIDNIPRIGNALVTQDTSGPALHLWDPDPEYQRKRPERCSARPGSGSISVLGDRFSDRSIFSYASFTSLVAYSNNGTLLIGEAEKGQFGSSHSGWNVKAALYTPIDGGLYDLRRIFYQYHAKSQNEWKTEEFNAELWSSYQKWLDQNDGHVSGSITADAYLMLKSLAVPTRPMTEQDTQEQVEWTKKLKLPQNPRARVRGRPYSTADVRAKLFASDGGWVPSIEEADPLLLNDDFLRSFDLIAGDSFVRDFYYAGISPDGRMLFEWGYGYILAVRRQDALDEFDKQVYTELFFGDRITAFTIEKNSEGEFGWKLKAKRSDIRLELDAQVRLDARDSIIQLVKVKKGPANGEITITDVSVTGRQFKRSGTPRSGWSFKRIYSASFDTDSLSLLQEELPDGESIVLAELDSDSFGKDSPVLAFRYHSIDAIRRDPSCLEKKVLCLTAGWIDSRSKTGHAFISNDYQISLYFPNETPDLTDEPRLQVNVLRREFSLDESVLRRLYHSQRDAFQNCNMMVRLIGRNKYVEKNCVLNGSVKRVPLRSEKSLRGWLEGSTGKLVTVSKLPIGNEMISCAEVFPGILFQVPEASNCEQWIDGTLSKIRLSEDSIVSETVLPGDLDYVPEQGNRPVELIVMDGVLNRYSSHQAHKRDQSQDEEEKRMEPQGLGTHFTVADFPQLRLNHSELLEKMIRVLPPRLAEIRRNGPYIRGFASDGITAGYLKISEQTKLPSVALVSPTEESVEVPWSRLTFSDDTVDELVEYVCGGNWRYHENDTGVFSDRENRMIKRSLKKGEGYGSVLVFFRRDAKNRLSLRYPPDALKSFGLSARGIMENGISGDPNKPDFFAVAASGESSVYIELFPGKIIDLPRTYLFLGKGKLPLDRLVTSVFGQGDRLQLSQEQTSHGERASILLTWFQFGLRSIFQNAGRMILPVFRPDADSPKRNAVYLGCCQKWSICYPLPAGELPALQTGSLAVLGSNNDLSVCEPDNLLRYGDCTLMQFSGRDFSLTGYTNKRVRLSKEQDWGSAAWLCQLLRTDPDVAINLFNGCLPVQVKGFDDNFIFVAYPAPRLPELNSGVVLCCNCLQCYQEDGVNMLILRSGGLLLRVPAEQILPGLDQRTLNCVVDCLSGGKQREPISFVITKTDDGWMAGMDSGKGKFEREITMLDYLSEANGILCRDKKDTAPLWLPLEHACRVSGVDGSDVWELLSKKKDRIAAFQSGCVISLNETVYRRSLFNKLSLTKDNYIVLQKNEISRSRTEVTYLGELDPFGELVVLKREPDSEKEKSNSNVVYAELIEKKPDSIVVIPRGERRERIVLSKWILSGYRRSCNMLDQKRDYCDLDRWKRFIPERFTRYREAADNADKDLCNGAMKLAEGLASLDERLVYSWNAFQLIQERNIKCPYHRNLLAFSTKTLREWLAEEGRRLALGFNESGLNDHLFCDLVPTIAAILLLNRGYNSFTPEQSDDAMRLNTHLARMLGFACGNTVHQEVILRKWLTQGTRNGLWARLCRIPLGGDANAAEGSDLDAHFDGLLSAEQKKRLVEIAGGVVQNYPDMKDQKLVAMALLHAVGKPDSDSEFFRLVRSEDLFCQKLSFLGKALTPPKENRTNWELDRSVIRRLKEVKEVFEGLMGQFDPIPLELISSISIPITKKERVEVEQLLKSVIEAFSPKRDSVSRMRK